VRDLYLQTVTAYFNLLTAQAAVVAAREVEASALAALKAATARVEAGTPSRPTACRPKPSIPSARSSASAPRAQQPGCMANWPP